MLDAPILVAWCIDSCSYIGVRGSELIKQLPLAGSSVLLANSLQGWGGLQDRWETLPKLAQRI